MTLDEAIKYAEEISEKEEKLADNFKSFRDYGNPKSSITSGYEKCKNRAKEHRQLAEWLKDYKRLLEQKSCKDTISRQAAIDEAFEIDTKEYGRIEVVGVDAIDSLPPVNPEPKIGHWIIIDDCEQFIAKCSECGRIEDSRMISKYPYCYCGAKMVEPQESEG